MASKVSDLDLVAVIDDMAADKGCMPAQLVLSWILHLGEDIVPIPDTKRRTYLDENLDALHVALLPAAAEGTRHPRSSMAGVSR